MSIPYDLVVNWFMHLNKRSGCIQYSGILYHQGLMFCMLCYGPLFAQLRNYRVC
jgi:hypothetical protein